MRNPTTPVPWLLCLALFLAMVPASCAAGPDLAGGAASPVRPEGNPGAAGAVSEPPVQDQADLPSLEEVIRTWPGATLRLGLTGPVPLSLNPAGMQAGQARLVASLVHLGVFGALDGMASTFEPDGRTCRFRVRKDLSWPDGVPVGRDAILESWKTIYANPDTRSDFAGQLAGFSFSPEGKEGILVKAPRIMDRSEMLWRLDVPLFPLHKYQAWRKLPNQGILGTGLRSPGDLRYFWRRDARLQDMLFAGPYRVLVWGQDFLVMEKNRAYPGLQSGGPQKLELRFYPAGAQVQAAFDAGQVDAACPGATEGQPGRPDPAGKTRAYRELASSSARVIVCRPGSVWAKAGIISVLKILGSRQGLTLWDNWQASRRAGTSGGEGRAGRTGRASRPDTAVGTLGLPAREMPALFPLPGISLPKNIRVLASKENPGWIKAVVRQFALIWRLDLDWAEPEWEDMLVEFRLGKTWDLALLGLDESRPPEDILPLLGFHDPQGLSEGRYPGPDAWPGDWAVWAVGPDAVITLAGRSRQVLLFRMP